MKSIDADGYCAGDIGTVADKQNLAVHGSQSDEAKDTGIHRALHQSDPRPSMHRLLAVRTVIPYIDIKWKELHLVSHQQITAKIKNLSNNQRRRKSDVAYTI
jgi:hypothetical protein